MLHCFKAVFSIDVGCDRLVSYLKWLNEDFKARSQIVQYAIASGENRCQGNLFLIPVMPNRNKTTIKDV